MSKYPSIHLGSACDDLCILLEAVLCTLLPSFSFELPKERIVWNIAGVVYPTMGTGSDTKSSMFLKVSPLTESLG